jgi:hypothetical protein
MRTAAVLFTCGLAMATYSLNASSNANLPDGWSVVGEAPKLYSASVDTSDSPSGKGSMVLRRTETSHPFGSAQLSQSIPVDAYAGKRVQVSVRARFQDIKPIEGQIFIGTESGSHLHGSEVGDDWTLFESTVTFPVSLKKLAVGVGLKGTGSAKVDSIELTVLGDAPPDQSGVSIADPKLNGQIIAKESR